MITHPITISIARKPYSELQIVLEEHCRQKDLNKLLLLSSILVHRLLLLLCTTSHTLDAHAMFIHQTTPEVCGVERDQQESPAEENLVARRLEVLRIALLQPIVDRTDDYHVIQTSLITSASP